MFFTKSTVLFSALALCNVAIAAQPPACLLSIVGAEPNPADLKTICIKNGDRIQDTISDKCDGDDKQDALKHFLDTCSANGHKVETSSTTSGSSSTTATATGSKSTSTAESTSTSGSSSSSSSGSSSGSGATASGSDSGSGATASGSGANSSPSTASDSSSSPSPLSTTSAGASDRHVPAAAFAAVVFVGFAATM